MEVPVVIRYTISDEDSNGDSAKDMIVVRSKDFDEPLFGSYKGVILCQIPYIAIRQDSHDRAQELAEIFVEALIEQEQSK